MKRSTTLAFVLTAALCPLSLAEYWRAPKDETRYSSPMPACLASAIDAWGAPREVVSMYYRYNLSGRLAGVTCPTVPQPGACFTANAWCRKGLASLVCDPGEWKTPHGCVTPPQSPLGPPECDAAADGGPASQVGNPINLISGNKFHQETDFQHTAHHRLAATRTYNSHTSYYAAEAASYGRFGAIWRSNLDRRLKTLISVHSDGTFNVFEAYAIRPGGAELAFDYSSVFERFDPVYWDRERNRWLVGRKGSKEELLVVGDQFELVLSDGTRERYSLHGRLLSIDYRDGYRLSLEYDDAGYNTAVTDSFGNTLLFTYDEHGLATALTDPDGHVTRFTYRYAGFDEELFAAAGTFATTHFTHVIDTVVYPDDTPADLTDNPRKQYLYDDDRFPWALTGIIDENGDRFATYAYDDQGRAISSEHAGGDGKVTIDYDDIAGTRTVTNALGKEAIYHLEPFQDRLKVARIEGLPSAHCAPADTTFEYDANGFLASETDGEGFVTAYVRDPRGRELSRTEGAGTSEERLITTDWHPDFAAPLSIQEPLRRIDFVYDAEGRLLQRAETDLSDHQSEPEAESRTWTYSYTPEGLLASMEEPVAGEADPTLYTYDEMGNLASSTNPLGHVTRILEIDASGRPLLIQDVNAVIIHLSYDPRGRLMTVTVEPDRPAGGDTTQFSYDGVGNMTGIIRPDGSSASYTYDAARRLTRIENSAGEWIVISRNLFGDPVQQSVFDSNGVLTSSWERTYDELGRLLETIAASRQTTTYSYDRDDRLTAVTDPLGREHQMSYDALGRLLADIDPEGFESRYEYTDGDHLASVTDARGLTTTYTIDGLGDLLRTTGPDTETTAYVTDSAGRPEQRTDARGVESQFTYDVLDRVTSITYAGSPGESVFFAYDDPAASHGIGRLTSVVDSAGTTWFDYDARGKVTGTTRTLGTSTYGTAYTYDAVGRLASISYPTGRIVGYHRDDDGRVTSITSRAHVEAPAVTIASSIEHQPFGPPRTMALGNGLELEILRDLDGLVERITVLGPQGTVLDRALNHDAAGNVTQIRDDLHPALSELFDYDPLDRLVSATGPYGTITYTYDPLGNRGSRTRQEAGQEAGIEEFATYLIDDDSNRLLAIQSSDIDANLIFADTFASGDFSCWSAVVGGVKGVGPCIPPTTSTRAFTYSHNGNLIGDSSPLRNLTFAYNHANRLARIDRDGTFLARYTYDAFEHRVSKSLADGSGVHYHYSLDGRILAETDPTGALIREYVWLDDLPVAMAAPAPAGGRQLVFLHTDHLHRPVLATGPDGSIVWQATYHPFGAIHQQAGNLVQPLRFPGQIEDSETGLFQNWHRTYQPDTGRYTRPDPLGLIDGLNLYNYAHSNPSNRTDPKGLSVFVCRRPISGLGFELGPLFHQYLCVVSETVIECGGQTIDRNWFPIPLLGSISKLYGPGRPTTPTEDFWNPSNCREAEQLDTCIDECVLRRFREPRPFYGIKGLGTQCQEWSEGVLESCREECSWPFSFTA